MRKGAALGTALSVLGLAVAALAVYLPAANAYFVGDDWDFLAAGVTSFGSAIRHTFWGVYMPVFTVSFWLDGRLWGFDPFGYHLTSFLFHGLATVAAFFLARALAHGDRTVGLVCGLLFALHPVHDEAVIYIAARAHLACTAFMLWTLYFHVRNRQTGTLNYHGRSVICFALATLSKETALVTPVLVVAADLLLFADGPNRLRRALTGVRPFALVSVAYFLVRFFFAAPSGDKLGLVGSFDWEPSQLPQYFLMEFLPIPGTLLEEELLQRLAIPGALLLAAIAIWVWLRRGRWQAAATRSSLGVLTYAMVFFVVATLPFLPDALSFRRRYAYPGSFGACLFLAGTLLFFVRSGATARRLAGKGLLVALLLACTVATIERGWLYRRSGRLVENIVEDLQSFIPEDTEDVRLRLLQLPRWTRGGPLRGAYLLHSTDVKSIVRYFRGVDPSLRTAFNLRHAEDHTSRVVFWDEYTIAMKLTCRTSAACASLVEEIESDEEDNLGRLRMEQGAESGRELRLFVHLERPFEPSEIVLYYSDGHLHRLLQASLGSKPALRP